MTESTGIREEIRAMLKAGPKTSAELYAASELATDRQQIYVAVHALKQQGEIETTDKVHRLAAGESEDHARNAAAAVEQALARWPQPPPLAPAPHAAPAQGSGIDFFESADGPEYSVFPALLDVLLKACAESADPGIRVLASAVREQWEAADEPQ